MPKVMSTTRTEQIVTEVTEVTITMTKEEAGYLMRICQIIGGTPEGPRGLFSGREDSLNSRFYEHEVPPYNGPIEGCITFE